MADTLAKALAELEKNLSEPVDLSATGNEVQEDIREQAGIVLGIVQAELAALNDDKQNSEGKDKQLSPLYKNALCNHYLAIVTTLNKALNLKETTPEKQKDFTEKLKKLADISKPALKSALYALASLCLYMTSLLTAAKVSSLVALAPVTTGASLVAAVPLTVAAGKIRKKGDDFFSESEKHFHETLAIKDIQEKVKLNKRRKK